MRAVLQNDFDTNLVAPVPRLLFLLRQPSRVDILFPGQRDILAGSAGAVLAVRGVRVVHEVEPAGGAGTQEAHLQEQGDASAEY